MRIERRLALEANSALLRHRFRSPFTNHANRIHLIHMDSFLVSESHFAFSPTCFRFSFTYHANELYADGSIEGDGEEGVAEGEGGVRVEGHAEGGGVRGTPAQPGVPREGEQ